MKFAGVRQSNDDIIKYIFPVFIGKNMFDQCLDYSLSYFLWDLIIYHINI